MDAGWLVQPVDCPGLILGVEVVVDLRIMLGSPAATIMITAVRELKTVSLHVLISAPILAGLFWLYVGSFFKAVTPLLRRVATTAPNTSGHMLQ